MRGYNRCRSISVSDWIEAGGVTPEESLPIAAILGERIVDLIDVYAGQISVSAHIELAEEYSAYEKRIQTW